MSSTATAMTVGTVPTATAATTTAVMVSVAVMMTTMAPTVTTMTATMTTMAPTVTTMTATMTTMTPTVTMPTSTVTTATSVHSHILLASHLLLSPRLNRRQRRLHRHHATVPLVIRSAVSRHGDIVHLLPVAAHKPVHCRGGGSQRRRDARLPVHHRVGV